MTVGSSAVVSPQLLIAGNDEEKMAAANLLFKEYESIDDWDTVEGKKRSNEISNKWNKLLGTIYVD